MRKDNGWAERVIAEGETPIPVLIFGEMELRNDWRVFARLPEAPRNYKDPIKITEYVAEKVRSLEEDVKRNCPWLLTLKNMKLEVPEEVLEGGKFETADTLLYNLLTLDLELRCGEKPDGRVIFLGPDASQILKVWSLESGERLKGGAGVRRAAVHFGFRCESLETLFFSAEERKMLLTDKLLEPFKGESEMETYRNAAAWFYKPWKGWKSFERFG